MMPRSESTQRACNTDEDDESTDAARFAINHFSMWITNADTKAGLLTAATTLLGGIAANQRSRVELALASGTVRNVVALSLFGVAAAALLVTVVFLVKALVPRTGPGEESRYGWPHVSDSSPADLVVRAGQRDRYEAWATAVVLAGIARRKYEAIRKGIWSFLLTASTLGGWLVLLP